MVERGSFVVEEIPGDRWEIALEMLVSAGHMFVLHGDVLVGLQRYAGWPGADGLIHVSICTSIETPEVTRDIAERDVRAGLQIISRAAAADGRLLRLFEQYGVAYDYVYDYGHGAVKIGDAGMDGSVRLLGDA